MKTFLALTAFLALLLVAGNSAPAQMAQSQTQTSGGLAAPSQQVFQDSAPLTGCANRAQAFISPQAIAQPVCPLQAAAAIGYPQQQAFVQAAPQYTVVQRVIQAAPVQYQVAQYVPVQRAAVVQSYAAPVVQQAVQVQHSVNAYGAQAQVQHSVQAQAAAGRRGLLFGRRQRTVTKTITKSRG